jgi:hypothetical protein
MSKSQLELVPVNEALVNEVTDSYVIRQWNEMLNANVQASSWTLSKYPNLSDAFSWQESPQGHEFWSVISRLFTIKTVKSDIPCGKIEGYNVTVLGDGKVKVGCTTLTDEQVADIIAAIAKQKEGE